MTWAAYKALTSGQRPVWLYELTLGATVTYHTPRATAFTYDSNSYAPTAIVRGKLPKATAEENKATFELTVPTSLAFAQSLIDGSATVAVPRVRVRSGDANDPDAEFVTQFLGRVVGFRSFFGKWGFTKLLCENDFTRDRARLWPRVMDRTCPYALFRGGCGLTEATYTTSTAATAYTGDRFTVTAASGQADGYYTLGQLVFDGYRQLIELHEGDQITLAADVPGLKARIDSLGSANVDIIAGCDKTHTTCNTKFSNIENFGGFPEMTDSPYGQAILD